MVVQFRVRISVHKSSLPYWVCNVYNYVCAVVVQHVSYVFLLECVCVCVVCSVTCLKELRKVTFQPPALFLPQTTN